jgi:hypothetical protein
VTDAASQGTELERLERERFAEGWSLSVAGDGRVMAERCRTAILAPSVAELRLILSGCYWEAIFGRCPDAGAADTRDSAAGGGSSG